METLPATDLLQQVIEQMPAALAVFDREVRYRAVSRRHLADLAWLFSTKIQTPDDVLGRTFHDVSPDMPARWGDAHARVLAGDELAQDEDFVPRLDGRPVWVRWSMRPWYDSHGGIGGALLFSTLITDQVEIRHALARSEALFRATFENAAVGISHVAPDGKFLRFNRALSRILGWPADELVTKTFQEITHPDDLAAELDQSKQLREGRIDSYTIEKRDLCKDGTMVWIRQTVSCVRKSDGSIDFFVGVAQDISDRKRAEEQVQFLMREANHRVKNLLSVVQAIVNQTGDRESDFVKRFTERIRALTANQDLLFRNDWQGADLDTLVCTQLGLFGDLFGSRIIVRGPKLHLNAAAAQAIGLAVHELATNAGKYGALSTDAGHVDVSWRLDGEKLSMNWTERGGPPVRPPQHRGFGHTVVDSMVSRTVAGEVQLDFAPSGVVWNLTCPAANALEPAMDDREAERR